MSPNVMAMIKAFNQLALMVPTEILAEKTPKARAKVIEAFIKVCEIMMVHLGHVLQAVKTNKHKLVLLTLCLKHNFNYF